ncbi:MAG: hypothetical protein WC428_07295 [Candidatus Paceibacterota bacterium]|jgi:hypothetical protein
MENEKASDIFNRTRPVFGKKVSFQEAFPEIKNIRVEIEEAEIASKGQKYSYSKENLGEYIDCSNPHCYGGGFSIGKVIREMVSERKTEIDGDCMCQGNEGSQKGRKIYRSCTHYFKYKVFIEYN